MARSDDAEPDDADRPSLLDALTEAGAAVDQAQVVGDIAAHRVVDVVAQTADGRPPHINDLVGPPAVESRRIAHGIADAASRYERARNEHMSDAEGLMDEPSPAARDELRQVTDDSARAESDAEALLSRIDEAEQRVRDRAADPTHAIDTRAPLQTRADAATAPTRLH